MGKSPCIERLILVSLGGSNPLVCTKLCVNAEMVDSPTAVGVKGSSPLEVRKTFSMVLLEVRILLRTPSLYVCSSKRFATNSSKSEHPCAGKWRLESFWACQFSKTHELTTRPRTKVRCLKNKQQVWSCLFTTSFVRVSRKKTR